MSTVVEWKEILLAVGSIIAVGAFTLLVKSIMYKYRRPNGKKGGIVSLHTALAFATITVVAMVTKDWFITAMTVILAYLIGRGRLDEGQHYIYQVVISAVFGILIPYGIFYLYYNKLYGRNRTSYESREEYDDKPERALDDRHEADTEAPELRIDDEYDLDAE